MAKGDKAEQLMDKPKCSSRPTLCFICKHNIKTRPGRGQTEGEGDTQRRRAEWKHAEAAGSDVLLEDTPVAGREGDGGAKLPASRDADAPAAEREGGGGNAPVRS